MEPAVTPSHYSDFHDDRDVIESQLVRLRRRIRLSVCVDAVTRIAWTVAVCLTIQFALDWSLNLRIDLRAFLLLLVIGVTVWTAYRRLWRPLRYPLSLDEIASYLERRFPHLNSHLISAIQYRRLTPAMQAHISVGLVRAMTVQAVRMARQLPLDTVVNHSRLRRQSILFCGLLGLAILITSLAPETIGVGLDRNLLLGNASWGHQIALLVLGDENHDGAIPAPRGEDFLFRVRVLGGRPTQVTADLRWASGSRDRQTLTAVGSDEFRLNVARLQEPVTICALGGGTQTRPVTIIPADRPRIPNAAVVLDLPTYTRREPVEVRADRGSIDLLPGTQAEISIATNKPLVNLEFECESPADASPETLSPTQYRVRFQPQRDTTCRFHLTDEHGWTSLKPDLFVFHLTPDPPPIVSLELPDVGEMVTPAAILPARVEAKDHFGLASAQLVAQTSADQMYQQPLDDLIPYVTQWETRQSLSVADLQPPVGTTLTVWAQASDWNDVTGPGVGQSAHFSLRVVRDEELLAELSRREHEARQNMEQIIERQEQLRTDQLSAAAHERSATPLAQLPLESWRRSQQEIIRQLLQIEKQFERIRGELVVNQLETEPMRKRLIDGIIKPLESLITTSIPELLADLDRLNQAPNIEEFDRLDRQHDQTLRDMRQILAAMAQWEGFYETVSQLQTIIKMQQDLRDETRKLLDEQLDTIFGKPNSPPSPKPH